MLISWTKHFSCYLLGHHRWFFVTIRPWRWVQQMHDCFLLYPFRNQLEDSHAGPQPLGIHTGINNTDTQCPLQQVSEIQVHSVCRFPIQCFKSKLLISAPFPMPHLMCLAPSRWVCSPMMSSLMSSPLWHPVSPSHSLSHQNVAANVGFSSPTHLTPSLKA